VLELGRDHDFWEPFRVIKKSKYIHYIFLALVLYGFSATGDRTVLSRFPISSMAYIVFIHIFLAINFFIMITLFHNGIHGIKNGLKRNGWWVLLVAVLTVSYRLAQAEAVKMAYVALVSAIKRTAVLFTIIIGGELFHESNLFRKSIASIVMIGGAILIVI